MPVCMGYLDGKHNTIILYEILQKKRFQSLEHRRGRNWKNKFIVHECCVETNHSGHVTGTKRANSALQESKM